MTTASETHRAAERAARTSYGRLLALVATRTHDIAGAEDALSDAFAAALRTWPERGVPDNPDAWLLTAARNALNNASRHLRVRDGAADEIARRHAEPEDADGLPDERLRLLFVCGHPAIDPAIRTPLMLQTVLGLDGAQIAAAFLVAPAAMSQRLVRAKAKIRAAGIRFELPDAGLLQERLSDVLDAVYAAYGAGWDTMGGVPDGVSGLADEAIYLGRLLADLLPDEPECLGLLALMLHCEARRKARRDVDGRFVPLSEQDPTLWSRDLIVEAERLLTRAARHGRFGRYQCEAAIQSVHAQRPITGDTNHAALLTLHDLLVQHAPSLGVLVARAAVLTDMGDAAGALRALDDLPQDRMAGYQPYWVTRSRVLTHLGLREAAAAALDIGIALTNDPSVRDFLVARRP